MEFESEYKISIVIPAYNEGGHIFHSLQIISSQISCVCKDYEIIIIDDGSHDNTWDQLVLSTEQIKGVKAFRLSRNFGKELALCAGLENATGDAVIIMDADLQHPPELIPQMISIWKYDNVDIVECVKRDRGKESLKNLIGAKIFYSIISKLTGYDLYGASDYKLLDRKVLNAWREMPERNTFFRGMISWLGFKTKKIEFDVKERVEGKSNWNILSLTKLAVQAVVAFSTFPLRIVSFIGILFFFLSILLGIQTIYHKIIGNAVTGFTTVILLILITGSIVMISLGVMGEYIAAIYNEVKGRPRYLICQRKQYEETSQKVKI
jgi:glycosyltransferase involved in cell wall biosynthesis